MRILFTGASSFTGMWFVQALKKAGHQVVAILRNPAEDYSGTRQERILILKENADVRFSIPYGSLKFEALIENERFDLFCHHAADVTNYKSPSFDPVSALKNNLGNLSGYLDTLKRNGCNRVLLTGSIFEQNEGIGSDGLRAVSPYGLSKGLTSAAFQYYCEVKGFRLGKFVIPNPFGPFEEFRFTSFLMQNWFEEKPVNISQPAYLRDNIHVSLLAKAYAKFAETLPAAAGFQKINPSGYSESQGDFTLRFANEMRMRLNLPCEFTLFDQKEFLEPRVRLNTDPLDSNLLEWDEKKAWDDLAAYYERIFSKAISS